MKLKHNKKRNVGLLYEFFSRFISQKIVEKKSKEVFVANMLLKKYFSKGTLLHKELNLFEALCETRVEHRETAFRILDDVKRAAKNIDHKKIESEKSLLISEINKKLNDNGKFFDYPVSNYKDLANIQNLINHYRGGVLVEEHSARLLEDRIVSYLLEKKDRVEEQKDMFDRSYDINNLVVKIAINKFNEKYSNFNKFQRKLVESYISGNCGDDVLNKFKSVSDAMFRKYYEDKEVKSDKLLVERIESAEKMVNDVFSNEKKDSKEKLIVLMKALELYNEL